MRVRPRRKLLILLALLLVPNLILSLGLKGQGMASGCFSPPTFAHDRGLTSLDDVLVFATAAPDTIQVYSVSQARVTNTLKAAERLQDMAVSPVDPQGEPNPRAYVATKSGRVAAYDFRHNAVLDEVKLSDDPEATSGSVAVSGDGKYVAVGIGDQQFQIKDIAILNAAKLTQKVASTNIGGDLQDLVANPNPLIPELYIVNDRADKIRIFDFSSMTMEAIPLMLTGSPSTFAISPDGHMALASINAREKVVFIDLDRKVLFYEVTLPGASPHRIAFSPDDKYAYVTDRKPRGSLYRFDLEAIRQAMAAGTTPDQATVVTAKHLPALLTNSSFVPETAAVSSDSNFLYLAFSNQTHISVVNLTSIDDLIKAHPNKEYDFMRDSAAQQIALADKADDDGLYEIQGVNLAKDPVTFGTLFNSNLVFKFTSPKVKASPGVNAPVGGK